MLPVTNGPMTAGTQNRSACLQETRGGGCPPARLANGILLLLCRPTSEVNVLPDVLRLITAQPTSKRPLQTKTIHTPWSVEEAHLPDLAARRGGGWRRCEAHSRGALSHGLSLPLQLQVNNILPGRVKETFILGFYGTESPTQQGRKLLDLPKQGEVGPRSVLSEGNCA